MDFDEVSKTRPLYAADLIAELPAHSRTAAALDPENAPADPAVILMLIQAAMCGGKNVATVGSLMAKSAPDAETMRAVAEALGIAERGD